LSTNETVLQSNSHAAEDNCIKYSKFLLKHY